MITIDGAVLTIEQVIAVARHNHPVQLSPAAEGRVQQSNNWVAEIVNGDRAVYGINTGFGIFADRQISPADAATLGRNLILSHAVGTGVDLPTEIVRAAMLIRANTLASGYSGVRALVIHTLLAMLNKGVTPVIPAQGSLGSSGDLAPLSHLCLVMTTDEQDREEDSGWAIYNGIKQSGRAAMLAAGIKRLVLGPKEGLALTNGATFCAAIAAFNVHTAAVLIDSADVSLAMSLEALLGASAAFDERVHQIRPHPGQIKVAERVRHLTKGSSLLDAAGRIQDAYSLRCAPQVQGPAREALAFVEQTIEREINAVTDNPLIFGSGDSLSGGNFHGEPVGIAMDILKIPMAEIGAIAERRIFHLTDGKMNSGLPPMLVNSPEAAGLHSGMMMPQYTAASLVLENLSLASPDSVYSLPTSGGKEDHNANAMIAARRTRKLLQNLAQILALEAYTAARAIDLRLRERPNAKLGSGVEDAFKTVRNAVPFQGADAWWGPQIEQVRTLINQGDLRGL